MSIVLGSFFSDAANSVKKAAHGVEETLSELKKEFEKRINDALKELPALQSAIWDELKNNPYKHGKAVVTAFLNGTISVLKNELSSIIQQLKAAKKALDDLTSGDFKAASSVAEACKNAFKSLVSFLDKAIPIAPDLTVWSKEFFVHERALAKAIAGKV